MRQAKNLIQACGLCPIFCGLTLCQSTQGLISGSVMDFEEGIPIPNVEVGYSNLATNTSGTVRTDTSGRYVAPLLPPGKYRLRVIAESYQAQELYELELPIASSLEVNFTLRPLHDVWQEGQFKSVFLPGTRSVLTFFGPDVDSTRLTLVSSYTDQISPLETGVSTVVNPIEIQELPLAGRDVYAAVVLQPDVSSDTSTIRGLGFSVNGQRPSSSNYLLDGLENNNYLLTGPLITVAPEAVQEYRVSIDNFSAEFGRTGGFVTNAVTRAGGNVWHATAYLNLKNDTLNANTFERNFRGLPTTPLKEDQAGFQFGGPIWKRTLFGSTAFEYLRSRSTQDPVQIPLPTNEFLNSEILNFTPGSIANKLLKKFPPPPLAIGPDCQPNSAFSAICTFNPPASLNRYLGLERVDYASPKGAHRIMGRLALARTEVPDFIWTPYVDFASTMNENTNALAIAWTSSVNAHLTNELRGSWSAYSLNWDRPHSEIPTMATESEGVLLPGSPAFYAYKNQSQNWELLDNVVWSAGRHIVKTGGGILLRRLDGYLTAGQGGQLLFPTLLDFALDSPTELDVSSNRRSPGVYQAPDFNRKYRYNQYFLFVQDSFKASSRLVLNYGLRYENFGAPQNVGTSKDAVVDLGPGASFPDRLASAYVALPTGNDQTLYSPDNNNWSVRFGFAYSLRNDSKTLLRGGYGTFYDRPFDNLWQNISNNNLILAKATLPAGPTNYLAPFSALLGKAQLQSLANFPMLTLYQPQIQDGYVQSSFLGLQHQAGSNLTLEIDATGSFGRKLITTDLVNRPYSVPITAATSDRNPLGYYNPALPEISYRSNQGLSNYAALMILSRYRGRRTQFQIAYTWSHSIDNQSDPLLNDFFDLSFINVGAGGSSKQIASFARQFDSHADRANSDFDQRHNLVFYSICELPSRVSTTRLAPLFRGWRISGLGAIRSGLPFSVLAPLNVLPAAGGGVLAPTRAELVDPLTATSRLSVPGGVRLLDPIAFQTPPAGQQGNTGRNEFGGPGLYNIDLSLSRSFAARWLREGGRLILRADAFNILNHANLNNPAVTLVGSSDFGVAQFGRLDRNTGFPALTPFNETARQIQLLLRIEF